jgi:hypothetical protein
MSGILIRGPELSPVAEIFWEKLQIHGGLQYFEKPLLPNFVYTFRVFQALFVSALFFSQTIFVCASD